MAEQSGSKSNMITTAESGGEDSDEASSSSFQPSSTRQFQTRSLKFINKSQSDVVASGSGGGDSTSLEAPAAERNPQTAISAPRFEFITTTGPTQHSGAEARSRVRAHVMRQVHFEKDKERASKAITGSGDVQLRGSGYADFEELIGLANVGLVWHRPLQGSAQSAFQSNTGKEVSAVGSSSDFPISRPSLDAWFTAAEPLGIQNAPLLSFSGQSVSAETTPVPALDGLTQRLVVSRNMNAGGLSIDLSAVDEIKHCVRIFSQYSIPISDELEGEWFKKVVSDPACYHGTMYVATAHRTQALGLQQSTPQVFYHKGETIRLVNERLKDPQRCLEDGTLASISCLAAVESLMGSAEIASLHVSGMKRIVSLRGGMENLGMSGLLTTMILWLDMTNSLSLMCPPRFCPWNEQDSAETREIDYQSLLEWQWKDWCLPLTPEKRYPNFDDLMTRIFHRLTQLSAMALTRGPPSIQSKYQAIFASHILLIESQLNFSFWPEGLNAERDADPVNGPTSRLFHIVAFIYVYMALKEIPLEANSYNKTVAQLKTTIESLDQSRSFGGLDPGFLLWVLIVGGTAAFRRPERSWFVTLFTRLRQSLQLDTWESTRSVFLEYPWVENTFATLSRGFWEESESMIEAMNMYSI